MKYLCAALALSFVLTSVPAAADTPQKTASGATFTLPTQWSVRSQGGALVLTAPEGDTHIAIVDAGTAADAAQAVAQAWHAYEPSMHRAVRISTPGAPRSGWDEIRNFDYFTSPNEHLTVEAIALRAGRAWTVAIVEGSNATLDKRSAAVDLVAASLTAAGYHRETFAGRTANRLTPARVAELLAFVRTGMKELNVPGVGIAFIDHGKVVYEGGLGVRDIGKPQPVDKNTLFMIASNTKGLTTLMMSRVVDQGKLRWNELVTQAYPSFRLGSPATTAKVRIEDLICACTGVPRKDFDWILGTTPQTGPEETFVQLLNTEPTSTYGKIFQYSNTMASAAGYIAGHLEYPSLPLGAAYDKAMQTLIFDPLGMSRTTFDMQKALSEDHASPHGQNLEGSTQVVATPINDIAIPYRPAGEAWSSPHDMIQYVENEITQGVLPGGKRFMSAKNLLQRRVHTVPVGQDEWYGMGLMDDRRDGVSVIHHGGDLIGFHSDWFAIPSAGVGAVILTNADSGVYLRGPLERRLLEVLYNGKPEAAAQVAVAAAAIKAETAKTRQLLTLPPAPDALAGLASHYDSPDLGHIDVRKDANGVWFQFGLWGSHMASRKNPDGTISLVTIDPGVGGFFNFVVTTKDGKPALVTADGQHKYVYTAASP
ncbi:MAG TPA: serine hydrolase domain-containing protein [Candidatus Baltobacteraceae bacterium]|nr:serine hydrolase domain-containing protein [Candidatus Baltobacteraceae bacterium]